jgi:hypothetical protein
MASNLYKYTGDMVEPKGYDSTWPSPVWYGGDGTTFYAFLDERTAGVCESSNSDLAATTNADDKAWVKANSRETKLINKQCQDAIRAVYSLEDELGMARTNDTAGKAAIAIIVDAHKVKINALVGD